MPDEYVDGVTNHIMYSPVQTSNRHSYDRSTVLGWVQDKANPRGPAVHPFTRVELSSVDGRMDHELRDEIRQLTDGGVP